MNLARISRQMAGSNNCDVFPYKLEFNKFLVMLFYDKIVHPVIV